MYIQGASSCLIQPVITCIWNINWLIVGDYPSTEVFPQNIEFNIVRTSVWGKWLKWAVSSAVWNFAKSENFARKNKKTRGYREDTNGRITIQKRLGDISWNHNSQIFSFPRYFHRHWKSLRLKLCGVRFFCQVSLCSKIQYPQVNWLIHDHIYFRISLLSCTFPREHQL